MNRGFSIRNIDRMARLFLPQCVLVALFFLNLVALPIPHAGAIKPQLVLMFIYYWAIYRPTLVPPWLCFATGILMDAISGMPLGVNALVFLVVHMVVRDQRRFLMGQPYVTIWAVFGLVAVLSSGVQWALYGVAGMTWSNVLPAMINPAVSFALFPFITLLLVRIHRFLPVASHGYS